MKNSTLKTLLAGGAAAALLASGAHAETSTFTVNFTELNGSGVSGEGTLVYTDDDETDDEYGMLMIDIDFLGLDQGPHPMHIHGLFEDGAGSPAVDSVTPTMAADAAGDNDGFIEVAEGVPSYGDILLSLLTEPGNPDALLTPNTDGSANYSQTFDLSDASIFLPSPATGVTYSAEDLFPLILREIVIHGLVVADEAGGGSFEISGDNCPDGQSSCYVALLPVAAAEIMAEAVPLPGAAVLFLSAGLAGGAFRFRRSA